MRKMTLKERVLNCINRHPNWSDTRVSNATGATNTGVALLRGNPKGTIMTPDKSLSVTPPKSGVISLSEIKAKLDIAQRIRKAIKLLPSDALIVEAEFRASVCGSDQNKFRRAVDNNIDEFRANRCKLRLDDDSREARWYWGSTKMVAEAERLSSL